MDDIVLSGMFKLNSTAFKITLILIFALILAGFNLRYGILKSEKAVAFEDWVKTYSPQVLAKDDFALPSITVQISSNTPEVAGIWRLDPKEGEKRKEQILRVLGLIQESRLFSLPLAESGPEQVKVLIEQGHTRFETVTSPKQIESNIQAQTFLKIFKIFSSEQTNLALKHDGAPIENQR